ncbi:hypothetical protein [Mycobacterium sp. 1274761.0]|uniref:hypothetical protein n=1 Tax=Mycobacterium sp. 1274761.0 TaxID=1834077 RepID=UPI000800D029|nr:hypothetical protein [Mycobacterium sp. 1274761.0]OBK77868.1 hypothetical protein A5651_03610 [Mycobacterium sp. 1274761.0]
MSEIVEIGMIYCPNGCGAHLPYFLEENYEETTLGSRYIVISCRQCGSFRIDGHDIMTVSSPAAAASGDG